jgi:hypothetical protein
VGAVSDLGYLSADERGEPQFVSLADRLPADFGVFTDVWRTFTLEDGVYFQAQSALLRWADNGFTVWRPTSRIFNRA